MEKFVILVAGGKGERMDSSLPKQFIKVAGKEIIFHSIDVFSDLVPFSNIIVVLPKNQQDYWKNITTKSVYSKLKIAIGGNNRFESVKSGLENVPNNALVAIHDSVRPLVSQETIINAFQLAEDRGSAIPVINCSDSLRKLNNNTSVSVDRSNYKLVQTPQCFQSTRLKKAYIQKYKAEFTDDASVYESIGEEIYLCDGNQENIKITYPHDLKIAESIFSLRSI